MAAAVTAGRVAALRAQAQCARAHAPAEAPDVVYCSITPGCEEHVLEGVKSVFGRDVRIFGGSAADDDISASWWLLASRPHGLGARPDVVLTAMWPSVETSLTLTSLYKPSTKSALVVRASGRTVFELDEGEGPRPAREVFDEWTGGQFHDRFPSAEGSSQQVLAESTAFPLARRVVDGDGNAAFVLLHPERVLADGGLACFAEVATGDTLHLLGGHDPATTTLPGLVSSVADTTRHAVSVATEPIRGAALIYCAGMMLAVQDSIHQIHGHISAALPAGTPFVTGFTFGEQGPVGSSTAANEALHGNLMYNLLLFGSPKSLRARRQRRLSTHDAPSPRDGEAMLDLLVHGLQRHGMDRNFVRAYNSFDHTKAGSVSATSFSHTLDRLGITRSDGEEAALLETLGGNRLQPAALFRGIWRASQR